MMGLKGPMAPPASFGLQVWYSYPCAQGHPCSSEEGSRRAVSEQLSHCCRDMLLSKHRPSLSVL